MACQIANHYYDGESWLPGIFVLYLNLIILCALCVFAVKITAEFSVACVCLPLAAILAIFGQGDEC